MKLFKRPSTNPAKTMISQSKLAALSEKMQGRIPVRIHFLDNSSTTLLFFPNSPMRDLVQKCLEKNSVSNPSSYTPYFGIYESRDGTSINNWIHMDTTVQEVLDQWQSLGCSKQGKFLFMIRLNMPYIWGLQYRDIVAYRLKILPENLDFDTYISNSEIIDSGLLRLQFIQAVYYIITGKYPCSLDQSLRLGSLYFLIKFGNFDPNKHKVGFLGNRIVEFLPAKHLKAGINGKKNTVLGEWERLLYSSVQEISPNYSVYADEYDPERLLLLSRHYMEQIFKMQPIEGCTFFRCSLIQHAELNIPKEINLAVFLEGLHMFSVPQKILIRTFSIEEIIRWGFKPNGDFYFEVPNDNNEDSIISLELVTDQGKVISDLLTDFAMAYLKIREIEEEREAQMLDTILENNPKKNTPLPTPPPSTASTTASTTTSSSFNSPDVKVSTYNLDQREKENILKLNSLSISRTNSADSGEVSGGSGNSTPRRSLRRGSRSSLARLVLKTGCTIEYCAAVKIQALYRGYSLRNEWIREDAAILIQAVYRGYRERVKFLELIETLLAECDYEEDEEFDQEALSLL